MSNQKTVEFLVNLNELKVLTKDYLVKLKKRVQLHEFNDGALDYSKTLNGYWETSSKVYEVASKNDKTFSLMTRNLKESLFQITDQLEGVKDHLTVIEDAQTGFTASSLPDSFQDYKQEKSDLIDALAYLSENLIPAVERQIMVANHNVLTKNPNEYIINKSNKKEIEVLSPAGDIDKTFSLTALGEAKSYLSEKNPVKVQPSTGEPTP